MRTTIRLLPLPYLAAAAVTIGTRASQAQISVEPLIGWTWEGQYQNWDRKGPNGHSRVKANLAPALGVGARASVPTGLGSTHLAIAYAHSRPELTVAYDFLFSTPESSSSSFGSVDADARTHKLALELTYAGPGLPLFLEIGGSVFARRVQVDTERMPNSSGSRTYDDAGASVRTSIGRASTPWGAPRLTVELGAMRNSGPVGVDVLSLSAAADSGPQWAPFVVLGASWRIRL
jgi:hypothetical protein